MPKQNKMMQLVNSRLRLVLTDGRTLLGQLLAYDKHMNLVLADVEEFRRPRRKQNSKGEVEEMRRSLGLIMLRGQHIVSLCPEVGPPPVDANKMRVPASALIGAQNATNFGKAMPPPGAPAHMGMPIGMGMPAGFIPPPGAPVMPPQNMPGMMPVLSPRPHQ